MAHFAQLFTFRPLTVNRHSYLLSSSSEVVCFRLKYVHWRGLGIPQKDVRIRLVARVEATPNELSPKDTNPSNGNTPKSRRDILLEYVRNVQPEFMELFVKRAPRQVVDAMRQTVTNMIGSLPPQFFAVTVTTAAENLAQLMYSVMMTGYMFRNAQYRLELQQSLDQVALPEVQSKKDAPDYAPGTQKDVTGEVIRWNNVSGPERIDAVKYIELLEAEIEELSQQVERISTNGENELLTYLKSLEPQNLQELASGAGEDVVFAMNTFIKRLLGASDPEQMKVIGLVSLVVADGGYAFTAENCVLCQCSNASWQLDCAPNTLGKLNCSSMECKGTSMTIGNRSISPCQEHVCSYAGYTNNTILTALISQPTCPAPAPASAAMGVEGLRWGWPLMLGLLASAVSFLVIQA